VVVAAAAELIIQYEGQLIKADSKLKRRSHTKKLQEAWMNELLSISIPFYSKRDESIEYNLETKMVGARA